MGRQTQAADASNDLTTTSSVRKMLGSEHYRVTDRLRSDNTRYFVVRGDVDLLKTFKTLVSHGTPYVVVDVEERGDGFRAEIEHEKLQDDSSDDDDGEEETPENFRSGSKLAGELAEEFAHIETTETSDGGDKFTVRNESLTGTTFNPVTEYAARHGFRVQSVMKDGRVLAFTRMGTEHPANFTGRDR